MADQEKKELPEELLIEISLRLPLKSVARFKCVSKRWNSFLSSPEFLHRERIIVIDQSDETPHVITLAADGGRGSSIPVRYSPRFKDKVKTTVVVGSCNGLVLLRILLGTQCINDQFSYYVINPVTSKATRVLDDSLMIPGKYVSIGLGYYSGNYKIVVIDDKKIPNSTVVKIFNGRSQTVLVSPVCYSTSNRPGVYTDGCIHWLCYKNHNSYGIVAVDLSTEKVKEVPLPAGYARTELNFAELSVMGGCLALSNTSSSSSCVISIRPICVWIMEKPGYWREFTIPNHPQQRYLYIADVVCKLGEFEFVLLKHNKEMVAYNCETGVWRKLHIDGLPKSFNSKNETSIMTFRESLECL